MKAPGVGPVDVLKMSPESAATFVSGLDEVNKYVLAVGMARLASVDLVTEDGYSAMRASFDALNCPTAALAAYAAFDWRQPKMDRIRRFHFAVCWAVVAALSVGKAGASVQADPRAAFFVDRTGIMPERLDAHFGELLREARRRGTLIVSEVLPGLTDDSVTIARGFLAFVHGKNVDNTTVADVARIASYVSWTEAEVAADANRNIESWQARLFAAGVRLGRSTLR